MPRNAVAHNPHVHYEAKGLYSLRGRSQLEPTPVTRDVTLPSPEAMELEAVLIFLGHHCTC